MISARLNVMTIKAFSFERINEKAKKLRKILIKFDLSPFTDFLRNNTFAPLIGTVYDERINAEDAWNFPEWLSSKIGNLDSQTLRKLLF